VPQVSAGFGVEAWVWSTGGCVAESWINLLGGSRSGNLAEMTFGLASGTAEARIGILLNF
jgi:hypothetical protein